MADKESLKARVRKDIEDSGLDVVKGSVQLLSKMVAGTRLRKENGLGPIIASGYQNIDPDSLTWVVECAIEAIPENSEKTRLQETYDYWIANMEEIMKDHGVTRDDPALSAD